MNNEKPLLTEDETTLPPEAVNAIVEGAEKRGRPVDEDGATYTAGPCILCQQGIDHSNCTDS